jgi:hypothetical protein
MTGKERILLALGGGTPDRVPFVPNIWQWFDVNEIDGTLPPELQGVRSATEALKRLGADIFSKFDGGSPTPVYHSCRHSVSYAGELPGGKQPRVTAADVEFKEGTVRTDRIETPFGQLTHVWQYHLESGAPFEVEHWWKDFEVEYPAIRFWLTDTDWQPDVQALREGLKRIGNDGTVIFQLLPSPLKQFHWWAGQVNATLFIEDHPREMSELARIHEKKSLEFLEKVVDLDDVWVFEVADNLDSLFYTPSYFREFCVPLLKKQAEMVHARAKYLFVHSCGRLKALAPFFLAAGVDCLEGQAVPPLGDWPLHEARALSDRLIVCGGMAAPEQELQGPAAAERLDAYVRKAFASMGDMRRFLFGSSCNTSPRAPYKNLLAFRDAAFRYGRLLR